MSIRGGVCCSVSTYFGFREFSPYLEYTPKVSSVPPKVPNERTNERVIIVGVVRWCVLTSKRSIPSPHRDPTTLPFVQFELGHPWVP